MDHKKEKLKNIFKKTIGLEPSEDLIRAETPQWDSLKHAQLVIALQEELHLSFSLEDLEKLNSFNEILILLNKKD